MYVQPSLEAYAQLPKPSKPPMCALHDPAIPAQFLAAFNTASCDTAEDSTLFQMRPAPRVVISLICMKLVGPPARAALQPFDCRYGIHTRLKHLGVMSVGCTHKDDQWDALSIYDDVSLGA